MRDKPSLSRNINSAPLHLFDKVTERVLAYSTLVYLTSLVKLCNCHYIILFLFLHNVFERTGKSYFQIFLQLLL